MSTPGKLSNGCVDVLVVQQKDKSFKSTPFQIYFATINKSLKTKEVTIHVNGTKSSIKMYVDKDLKPRFQLKKNLRSKDGLRSPSDSQQFSDEDRSERSRSRERKFSPSRQVLDTSSKLATKSQKLQALKNEAAPFLLWPFAWLSKKKEPEAVKEEEKKQTTQPNMQRIEQEMYEGEENSDDPQFLLSLCGNQLSRMKKDSDPKQILKIFYKNKIQYKDFIQDPLSYLSNQDLVVKIDKSIYTWDVGLAIITTRLAFGKSMSQNEVNRIIEKKKSWLNNIFSDNRKRYNVESDERGFTQLNRKPDGNEFKTHIKFSKTPSSEIIKELGLNMGSNEAKFTLDDTGETVQCHIYLWDYKTKIVVSDIDGTITRTDIFGQLMPVFNNSWIHEGVVKLFNKIEQNGYEIVYLTARAIVQYKQTRDFLFNFVKDSDEQRLPLGPVFTSPDGLYNSFKRQIIDKQPDFLKTQILTVIKDLFPLDPSRNPLCGGFGNKQTDATSYKNSNINLNKIFIIGENSIVHMVTVNKSDFQTTYSQMAEQADQYFPKIIKEDSIIMQKITQGYPPSVDEQPTSRISYVDRKDSDFDYDAAYDDNSPKPILPTTPTTEVQPFKGMEDKVQKPDETKDV